MSRAELEASLDRLISRIVRLRDHNCITCGRPMLYETATAWHFIHRSKRCTRWSLINVNGQCWPCNHRDDTRKYENAMVLKYGDDVVARLKELAWKDCKYSVADLKEIRNELNDVLKQMK